MTADTDSVVRSWEHPIETGEMPESGTEFDAIIVGGGPGGAAAAGYLAKPRKSTVVGRAPATSNG